MILLDAGPLVALLDRKDQHHRWAAEKVAMLPAPLWTCGAVLSETNFLTAGMLPAPARLRELLARGIIRSVAEDNLLWSRAFTLMDRYANVPMSFADACLVTMAEAQPRARVFTLDSDFSIYRQHGDQPLALLAPFVE
jgi:uncharacterized protein